MCLFLSLPLSNLVFWSHGGQKKRRGQTLFYSNPKPSEQTQIQPNRIYSRVPLQMVICRLSIGSGAGPPVIDTTTTTQLREEVEEEEMLTSCDYFTFCNYFFCFMIMYFHLYSEIHDPPHWPAFTDWFSHLYAFLVTVTQLYVGNVVLLVYHICPEDINVFHTDIHGDWSIHPNDFGQPLTLLLPLVKSSVMYVNMLLIKVELRD